MLATTITITLSPEVTAALVLELRAKDKPVNEETVAALIEELLRENITVMGYLHGFS